jgi:hypothetical protein
MKGGASGFESLRLCVLVGEERREVGVVGVDSPLEVVSSFRSLEFDRMPASFKPLILLFTVFVSSCDTPFVCPSPLLVPFMPGKCPVLVFVQEGEGAVVRVLLNETREYCHGIILVIASPSTCCFGRSMAWSQPSGPRPPEWFDSRNNDFLDVELGCFWNVQKLGCIMHWSILNQLSLMQIRPSSWIDDTDHTFEILTYFQVHQILLEKFEQIALAQ